MSSSCPSEIYSSRFLAVYSSSRRTFGGRTPYSFDRIYALVRKIGDGKFGCVFEGARRCDGRRVAVKFVRWTSPIKWIGVDGGDAEVPLEVFVMRRLRRCGVDGVIRILDYYYEPAGLVIVMEYFDGAQDLKSYICERGGDAGVGGPLPTAEAREIFRQLARTVKLVQDAGVDHRDLKPANVLIRRDDGDDGGSIVCKLIDFGYSVPLLETPLCAYAGTKCYNPPEWFHRWPYLQRPAAVWSLGVILYELVHGVPPFGSEREVLAAADLRLGRSTSPQLRNLIRSCLAVEPEERPTVEEVLEHRWLSKRRRGTAKRQRSTLR